MIAGMCSAAQVNTSGRPEKTNKTIGSAYRRNQFQQALLVTGKLEVRARSGLPAHFAGFSEGENHKVGLFRRLETHRQTRCPSYRRWSIPEQTLADPPVCFIRSSKASITVTTPASR